MHKDHARAARAVSEVNFRMPTQEERLQLVEYNLEHFKSETIKAYSDMAMEFVMLKGLTLDGVKRIISLGRTADEHTILLNKQSERLDRVETTLSEHTAILSGHTAILSEHTAILSEHTAILSEHTAILSEHTVRLDRIETTLSEHTGRFDHVETLLGQILARLPEKP